MLNKDTHTNMNPLNLVIGQNIKQLRKRKALTTEMLGQCLGVSQQQVSRYERGINNVHISLLVELSYLFHVPILDFFKGYIHCSDFN